MDEAETPSSIPMSGRGAWDVHHAIPDWRGIELDGIRVIAADPGLTNRERIEMVRRDEILYERTFPNNGVRVQLSK